MPLAEPAELGAAPRNWQDIQQRVDGLANPMVEHGTVPGVVVGISLPDGERHFFSYGRANTESAQPLTKDSILQVGSLSKGFLSALLEILVEDGVFAWDDTLAEILPPSVNIHPKARNITLLELVTHTSGLPRQIFDIPQLSRFARFLFTGENIYAHLNKDTILSYLSDPSIQDRGHIQYSNIGYSLIGLAIEHRTGRSVPELIEHRLFDRLGLKATQFDVHRLPPGAPRAQGHAGDQPKFVMRGTPVKDWEFDHAIASSAGAFSNAEDLLAYAAAHLHQASGSADTTFLQRTLTPRVCDGEACAGLAWTLQHLPAGDVAYQVGLMGGYTSYVGIHLQKQIAVVVLMNGFSWENKIGHTLLAEVPASIQREGVEVRDVLLGVEGSNGFAVGVNTHPSVPTHLGGIQ